MYNADRTIAAVSTPYGKGGVAVIRISGEKAVSIGEKVFECADGAALSEKKDRTAVYGRFYDSKGCFDDGIVTVFRAPKSYTGEDIVEMSCHGGILVTQRLLSALFFAGAAPASAGEFTRRAFMNGKLTLTEAEAVAGIIDAASEKHLEVSVLQTGGALSARMREISDKIMSLLASVYVYIDYPDEELSDVSSEEMRARLGEIKDILNGLTHSYKYGSAISDGIDTVIVGRPNIGKSSILNLLAGRDRAIVTDIPGTTRDVVTERIVLGDVVLQLSDTAGLRESEDAVERLGIEKSYAAMKSAQLILAVFDMSEGFTDEDKKLAEYIQKNGYAEKTIYLLNKSDLNADITRFTLEGAIPFSALASKGVDSLIEKVETMLGTDMLPPSGEIITSSRQHAALEKCLECLHNADDALDIFTPDTVGMDLEEALSVLGEVDGRQVTEQVVAEIFSRFCVGK